MCLLQLHDPAVHGDVRRAAGRARLPLRLHRAHRLPPPPAGQRRQRARGRPAPHQDEGESGKRRTVPAFFVCNSVNLS